MTPEQEILEDALIAARQRAATFAQELAYHAKTLPLDPMQPWDNPSSGLQTDMAAFTKRYEMTHDLVTRRLFRSVLAVKGTIVRTQSLANVVRSMAEFGIVSDLARWDEITKLRNSLAHDYALSFAATVRLLNQAWQFSTDLLDMIARVDRYVAEHELLAPGANDD